MSFTAVIWISNGDKDFNPKSCKNETKIPHIPKIMETKNKVEKSENKIKITKNKTRQT